MGETNFQPREFPRRGSKAKDRKEILQGLRVAQAAVTKRWPLKVEKTLENQFFNLMVGGKDITDNNFEMQNVVIYFESNNSWSHNYEIT